MTKSASSRVLGDRPPEALQVLGHGRCRDHGVDSRLPEVRIGVRVERAHAQRRETGPGRPRLVADRVHSAEAQEGDAQAVALHDRGASRLGEVQARARDRDPLLSQQVERVLEPHIATVDHVVVGARHHVEAHLAEHGPTRARGAHEVLVGRRLRRPIGVDTLAVAEHDVGRCEQRLERPERRPCIRHVGKDVPDRQDGDGSPAGGAGLGVGRAVA